MFGNRSRPSADLGEARPSLSVISPDVLDSTTLRLTYDEVKGRSARLADSSSRVDGKATTILGFISAVALFLASQKASGGWKLSAFALLALAAIFGILAMRPRTFMDAPEPDALIEHVLPRGQEAALLLLIHASRGAFNTNKATHARKAKYWHVSAWLFTAGVALTIAALVFGGSDDRAGKQRPGSQPSARPSPSAEHGSSLRPSASVG
jgi:hypothetical protein